MISDQEASCWSLEIGCAKALQGGTNSGLSTGDCSLWKQADLNSPTRDVTARCSLVWPLPVFGYVAEHNEKKCESKCNPGWQDSLYLFACMCVCARLSHLLFSAFAASCAASWTPCVALRRSWLLRTPAVQQTQTADKRPSRCQWPSRRTPGNHKVKPIYIVNQ